MKLFVLLSLFILVSCASAPERKIASDELIFLGEMVPENSKVMLIPSLNDVDDVNHFYLEIRGKNKKLVDVDLHEIQVKEGLNHLSSRVRRLAVGKYEIELNNNISQVEKLKFIVQKKNLKHRLVILKKPHLGHSRMTLVMNENHRALLRVTLKDKNGDLLDIVPPPEVIIDGIGEISEPRMISKGIWEFTIVYPEHNQIFYVSVRANDMLLDRLFRFQHVEK